MKSSKIIIGGTAIFVVLAVLTVSGCTTVNTVLEHRQDKTTHDAAKNIELTVTTFNGNVEIQESPEYDVEVTYDISAPQGHLQHIMTGTNGSRNGNTLKLTAEAKLSDSSEKLPINHGANIIVKVPKNSTYNINIMTSNGNVVVVPQLNGNKMIVDTSNGDINVIAGYYTAIDATTSNGDIDVKLQNSTQFFVDASTSNGRISHGTIRMLTDKETSTGLIGYTESGRGNLSLVLQTSNGNIDLSYV